MPVVADGVLAVPRAWVTGHLFSARRVLAVGALGHGHVNVLGAAVGLASGAAVGAGVPLRLSDLRERLQLRGNASRDRKLIGERLDELARHEVVGRHLRATGDAAAPYELCELFHLSLELERGAVLLHAGRRQSLRLEPLASWFDLMHAADRVPWMREDLARRLGRRDLKRNVTRALEVLAAAGGERLGLERQRLVRLGAPVAQLELEPWTEREPPWRAQSVGADRARAATSPPAATAPPPGCVLRPMVSARRGGEPERARFAVTTRQNAM